MGADHLRTLPDLRGACAVSFDGPDLVVCTPEAMPPAGASVDRAPQVWRCGLRAAELSRIDATVSCASDCDVSADGVTAVADLAGRVVTIARDGSVRSLGEGVFESVSGVAWSGQSIVACDRRIGSLIVLGPDGTETDRAGNGTLRDPQGLDVAADGSVFVADRLANCIWHFARGADGKLSQAPRAIGERGTNPGQFNAPCDVVALEHGGTRCLVVADEMNHRVQVLGDDGGFVGFFGMHALFPRQGDGRIHYPRSVAVDAAGTTLAVAEPFEDRVQLFTLKAEPNPPDAVGGYEFITSHFGTEVACAEDLLVLVDTESQGVALLDARTTPPIHMAIIGGLGAMTLRFTEVSAIAVEPKSSRVWVADRGRGRLEVFDTVWDRTKAPVLDMFIPRLARSVELASFTRRLPVPAGRYGMRTVAITDIAFDPRDAGRVLLLDAANRSIVVTDPKLAAGIVELLPAAVRSPEELAIADDGRIAVVDPVLRQVFERSIDGTWSALSALGDIDFARPTGVAFGSDGGLVVADAARDGCIVGAADGSARLVGARGELDEQFFEPQSSCPSPLGLIVVDRGNHRFQRFGAGFAWNLTGSMGRYYDQKRRGSPGAAPASTPNRSGGES